jgi:hypothetical protein
MRRSSIADLGSQAAIHLLELQMSRDLLGGPQETDPFDNDRIKYVGNLLKRVISRQSLAGTARSTWSVKAEWPACAGASSPPRMPTPWQNGSARHLLRPPDGRVGGGSHSTKGHERCSRGLQTRPTRKGRPGELESVDLEPNKTTACDGRPRTTARFSSRQ